MTSEISRVDVVGVGVNATDTIIELPHFPSLDTKMELTSARVLAGGQVATAVAACAAWGLKTRFMGRIGDDAAGPLPRGGGGRPGGGGAPLVGKNIPPPASFIPFVSPARGGDHILSQAAAAG